MPITRRTFFTSTAAALAGAACASRPTEPPAGGGYPPVIGVQLYTVRSLIPDQARPTLEELARIGYGEAEVLTADLDLVSPILREIGMPAVSGHLRAPQITGNWDAMASAPGERPSLEETLERAARVGLSFVVMPFLYPGERGGLDVYRSLADKLNQAGEKAKAAGMHLCYHNHAFELEPMEGSTPLHVLAERMDAGLATFELDVFWVSVAGHDPAAMLRELAGRVSLVHLKDKAPGVGVQYEGRMDPADFKELGQGSLDFPAILAAGRSSGVRHYFVEQDQTPGHPVDSLRASYSYLRSIASGA